MDLDIRKTRTCERCKTVVLLEKVRLMPKSNEQNMLLCDICCEDVKNKAAKLKSSAKKLPKENYVNYFCNRCRYNFKADDARVGVTHNLSCPYCGKIDQLEQRPGKQEVPALLNKLEKVLNNQSKFQS